jgi:hypothetical protein
MEGINIFKDGDLVATTHFLASVHADYAPFLTIASDADIGLFIRAQIAASRGENPPKHTDMSKALYDAHTGLMARLEETRRKKSEAGQLGGNPLLKQTLSTDKAQPEQTEATVKPDTVTNTDTISVTNSSITTTIEDKDSLLVLADKANKTNGANKIKSGEYVTLSEAEYNARSLKYGVDILSGIITYLNGWAIGNGQINEKTNWAVLVDRAYDGDWGGCVSQSRPKKSNKPSKGKPRTTSKSSTEKNYTKEF